MLQKAFLAFLMGLSLMGCGSSYQSHSPQKPTKMVQNPKANSESMTLLREDLKALESSQIGYLSEWNSHGKNRFMQIFGGHSGRAVKRFIDERIHYYLSPEDLESDSGSGSSSQPSWTQVDNAEKIQNQIGAANLGTQAWLQGLIDNKPIQIVLKNKQVIPVTSSRVGVMLIGPAYNITVQRPDGSTVSFPQEFRQSVLIHEARHSDCVGGLTQEDLRVARSATSYADFVRRFSAKSCGYLHSICTQGDFKGYPACDSLPWGSYGVEAVYLETALKEAERLSEKWQILQAMLTDTYSRLLYDYHVDMIDSLEDPDLNSMGLR